MPAGGKCVFNPAWLTNNDYKNWLQCVKGERHNAFCKICSRKFCLASMGLAALKSPINSSKHQKLSKSIYATNATSQKNKEGSELMECHSEQSSSLHSLSNLSKSIIDAEILWSLKCVESHFSAHSNIGMNDLFKKMFSDSQIAEGYSLSESKYRYITTFGLGPHFAKKLLWDVQQSPAHTLLFDESLNEELQTKQMDVYVRYWSNETDMVESRYFVSLFMGHGKVNNLLQHYEEATKDLDASKTRHIGMDGPNVNLAFERELKKIRAELNLPSLIELGTCGLHTVHRAFQTGAKAAKWDLDNYLKKEYKLFKDSPARREDYVTYTGVDMFPSKFCNHRWLENLTVANRSITLLPHIKEYCNQAALNKTEPKDHAGYQSIKKAEDMLLKAKHHFWISLAQDFQEFLKVYQTEKPMIPFLATDLQNLLRLVLHRFVKESVLSSANSFSQLAKIDVSLDKNKKLGKELDIAILTRKELCFSNQNEKPQ